MEREHLSREISTNRSSPRRTDTLGPASTLDGPMDVASVQTLQRQAGNAATAIAVQREDAKEEDVDTAGLDAKGGEVDDTDVDAKPNEGGADLKDGPEDEKA